VQLYPIVLIAVLLLADGGFGLAAAGPRLAPATAFGVAVGGVLVVLGLAAGGMAWCRHRLVVQRKPTAFLTAARIMGIARAVLLVHFGLVVLWLGWLQTIRSLTGDLIAVDELVALLPTIIGVAATWWLFYPLERRVREALLIRQLDEGRAVFGLPARGVWVLTQLRTQLFFLLVPMLMILTLAEVIDAVMRMLDDYAWAATLGEVGTLVAAVMVVIAAPLLSRLVLDVTPLAEGPQRDGLVNVCQRHRVKIREILIWNTYGSMINAAVLGMIGRIRYVLLTDALMESMTPRQVEVVMAHEIGHVRRHHMPWLLVSLLAAITLGMLPLLATRLVLAALDAALPGPVSVIVGSAAGVTAGLFLFGWVSRRFERQADVFAVAHVAAVDGNSSVFSDEAVDVTCETLERIASLNSVAATRSSWRHGSIAWRQAYLRSIAGSDPAQLFLDRQILWIKISAALIMVVGVTASVLIAN
jgi:STE24 endopeptidase